MEKETLILLLNRIGEMLEILGENPFKSRSYYNAARIIEGITEDIKKITEEKRWGEYKGIGEGLAEKITEFIETGQISYYDELHKKVPDDILEMLSIPGLGPKKISVLVKELDITSIRRLERACREDKLIGIKGFGVKTQENILKGIEFKQKSGERHLLNVGLVNASRLFEYFREEKSIQKIEIAGSLRRFRETIKDIDILVQTDKPEKVTELFIEYPEVTEVIAHGPTKSSIRLKDGLSADLRVIKEDEFPFALHYFTGSKEHNIAMRSRAKEFGLKLNEYGLFDNEGKKVHCKSEEEIFKKLKLSYIPPELRENFGELEAAEKNEIPDLIKDEDLKGIVHVHSTYSDGLNTIQEMAEASISLGYSYIVFCDHSKTAFYANGLSEERVLQQFDEIDRVNGLFLNKNFRIFKGIESDILPDGRLDYADEFLDKFDLVVGSVHSSFKLSEEVMTERVVKALRNPYLTVLGHPTGRLLLSRDAYKINLERVVEVAGEENVLIEINSNPHRLDLDWRFCRLAREKGVQIMICPDAHRVEGIADVKYGLGIARKGWLTARDVVNTLALNEFEGFLRENKRKRLNK